MEKSSTKSSLADEMKNALIDLGGPCEPGNRPRWLARVAGRVGITYRSAKTVFYREKDYPNSCVVEAINAARDAANREKKRAQQEKEASERDAMAAVFERLAFLENRLAQIDAELTREDVEALRAAAQQSDVSSFGLGNENRAMDQKRRRQ